jgi:PKD repeat protein
MKLKPILLILVVFCSFSLQQGLCAEEKAGFVSEFLYKYAYSRYKDGDIEDAIHEARKSLMADPGNLESKNLLKKLLKIKKVKMDLLTPRALFESPSSLCVNQEITFDASKSHDPVNRPLNYLWDFGDGTTSDKAVVKHDFKVSGEYVVKLKVQNDSGLENDTAAVSRKVVVSRPPEIVLLAPEKACVGEGVAFDASGSNDPKAKGFSYYWDFGDGAYGLGPEKIVHIYNSVGEYIVSLTIDNMQNTPCSRVTAQRKISVKSPPIADAGENFVCCLGRENYFDASGSSDPDGDKLTYKWNFGDGSTAEGGKATHKYIAAGDYQVTLTVEDDSGFPCNKAEDSFTAHVSGPPQAVIEVRE